MTSVQQPLGEVATFIATIRADLRMSREAFGAMTTRTSQSIRRYERGLSRPPAIFFHDLIEAAPECGLRFNDIAANLGYHRIDSCDPARYASIHAFFTGVRVLNGRSRTAFAAILSVPAPHISAIEHSTKPEPELVQRLARRFLKPTHSYSDVVRRFRTLRPSPIDLRLRQSFRNLHAPGTEEEQRNRLREQLISENTDLARRLAMREARRLARPDDAAEAWTIALVKAVDGHDPRRGDFIPYLRKRVFGEVRRQARCRWQSGTATVLRGRTTDICHARDRLRQQLQREPTVTEIAAHLALPTARVAEALDALAARYAQPLEADVAETAAAPTEGFSETIRQRLTLLDEHLRRVIELRFVDDFDLAEIADQIGVDTAAAESMLNEALLQLRQRGPF